MYIYTFTETFPFDVYRDIIQNKTAKPKTYVKPAVKTDKPNAKPAKAKVILPKPVGVSTTNKVTIVYFDDGTRSKVTLQPGDRCDVHTAITNAIVKRLYGWDLINELETRIYDQQIAADAKKANKPKKS